MTTQTPFRRAAIVSTGSEILQGLYADTNARLLAEHLSALGIGVTAVAAAPDDPAQFEATLRFAASQSDLVVVSGGLGPTEDDVNRDVFARVFGAPLVLDPTAVEKMRARFAARGRTMNERNIVQAMVPAGCTVFQNEWGTAPGYFLPPAAERGVSEPGVPAAGLIALPGPPREMAPMLEACALPILRGRAAGEAFVLTRTVHTFGVPESDLNEQTRDLFRSHPDVTYTILAKGYGVDFRITARAATRGEAEALVNRFDATTRERVGRECVVGADGDTMASVVGAMLRARGATVCTAESCTGGLVAKLLTDIPGSSAYLVQGAVTYANEAKVRMLGVGRDTLAAHGAVSAEVAREMAAGARASAGTDYALALTGIAGPDGGTPEKPVGLVFLALAAADGVRVVRQVWLGDREQIRTWAALAALDLLRKKLAAEEIPGS